jgi:hypothetical protein
MQQFGGLGDEARCGRRRAVSAGSAIVDIERSVGESPAALVRPVVLHLLWAGELVADMTRPLDGLT